MPQQFSDGRLGNRAKNPYAVNMKTLVATLTVLPQLLLSYPVCGRLAISLSAGILMGATVAPVNAWFLAWVALIPLWLLLFHPLSNSPASFLFSLPPDSAHAPDTSRFPLPASLVPVLYALAWGIGYHGFALSWLTGLHPLTWLGVPWLLSWGVTLFAWGFVTFWGASLVGAWAGLLFWLTKDRTFDRRRWYSPNNLLNPLDSIDATHPITCNRSANRSFSHRFPRWLRVLIAVALWCGLEAIWSRSPLYWSSLAYTQSPHNLAILHLGQISGPTLVTGAIVAVNGLLAEAWLRISQQERSRAKTLVVFSAGLLIVLHLVGLGLYRQPLRESPETALTVGIIQGNVPTRIKHFEEGVQLSLNHYVEGYNILANQGVEAVLTPEGAFPWLWIGTSSETRHPFYQAVLEQGVPAWVGTPGIRDQRITQSLFTLDGMGQIFSRYDKVKPVPLGEYIPFEQVLGNFISRLSPIEANIVPGSPNQRVDTPFGQAIVGICFDSAFPFLFRRQAATGGEFILTASNNDPYDLAMMTQHHALDVMRAIETNRWAVRATNTGLSGIIDPHGNSPWISGFRTYEIHAHTIYRRRIQTLYVRWGDWGLVLLLGLAIAGKVWEIRRSHKDALDAISFVGMKTAEYTD